jgi:hypothetical protein
VGFCIDVSTKPQTTDSFASSQSVGKEGVMNQQDPQRVGAFKPANPSPNLRGLFPSGGSAHPGAGMTMADVHQPRLGAVILIRSTERDER